MKRLYQVVVGLCLLVPSVVWGQAFTIENPVPGGTYSGIGALTGWRCTGGTITFVFDTGLVAEAGYGTSRNDTIGPCGDANNGFAALINFNLLGDGQHTVSVRNNGTQFASVTFNVKTLGAEFLAGKSGTYQLHNFPNAGQTTTVQWQQSSQNFIITNVTGSGSLPNVAGLWGYDVDFLSEDCNFLTVPPDLPTNLTSTFSVNQNGANLTAVGGTVNFTGSVEADGSFTLIGPINPTTSGPCTFAILTGFAGNFLEGNMIVVLSAVRVSGTCTGVSLPCSTLYFGTLTDLDVAAARTAERSAVGATLEQAIEQMRSAVK